MKKIYTLIFLAGTSLLSKAQYTITSSSNPAAGDIEKYWALDTAGLVNGTSGANQTWNYTNITIPGGTSMTTNSYVAAASVPNNSAYPSANVASTQDGNTFNMYSFTNVNAVFYGTKSNTSQIVYSGSKVMYTLPLSYNSTNTDTYTTSFMNGPAAVTVNGTITTSSDAYGTLNTPGNSYSNVLRVKMADDQTWNYGGNFTNTVNIVTYSYYNASSKFPLLSVTNMTNASPGATTTTITKAGTVSNAVLQGIEEQKVNAQFSLYPNPAANKEVTVSFSRVYSENLTVTVYNSVGQKAMEINIDNKTGGKDKERIDLSSLQSGIYFVKLKGNNLLGTQKLIIQ